MFRRPVHSLPQRIELADNQVLTLRGRRMEITCLDGLIWITDGAGGDRVIKSGQQATLTSKGVVCLQAFTRSSVLIRSFAPAAYRKGKHHARSLHDAAVEC